MAKHLNKASREARLRSSDALSTARGEDFFLARAVSDKESRVIGRLSEGSLHAYLKKYIEPDESYHEQKILDFWADVARDGEIFEIQTRQFGNLRRKLEAFLPEHRVTVIYPIAETKYLSWIDPDTGETTEPRLSPKKGKPHEILAELYYVRDQLMHPNLTFRIIMLELTEYKSLCGWSADRKRGSWRVDRVPGAVTREINLSRREDFAALLPKDLPEIFTAAELAKAYRLKGRRASYTLATLASLGIIEKVGERGRAFLYSVKR